MINAHFNPMDSIRALNEGKQSTLLSDEQAKSFRYKAEKHMRDLNNFTMNSIYNFYKEGVIRSYMLKIGEFDPKFQ